MTKYSLSLAALSAALVLSACGHGHSALPPAQTPVKSSAAATVSVTVRIPAKPKTAGARTVHYISPNTKSIWFWSHTTDGNWQTQWNGSANVTPGSPGCTTDTGGNTTCMLTFGSPGGQVQYTVDAYDGTNAQGNLLGSASDQATFVTGADNKFSITLDGVATKYVMQLAQTTLHAGQPSDDAITISAYDADGNLIVNSPYLADPSGTPLYNSQILSSDNVDGWAFKLNGATQTTPPPGTAGQQFLVAYPYTGLSVHYNGAVQRDVTFSISAPSGAAAQGVTLHVAAPTNSATLIYASGCCQAPSSIGYMVAWPGAMNGTLDYSNDADAVVMQGGSCGTGDFFSGAATDAQNHVAYIGTAACGYQNFAAQDAQNAISWEIDNVGHPSGPGLLSEQFLAIGFDSSNNIYGYEDDGPTCKSCTTDIGAITVLKAGSAGTFSTSMDLRAINCVNAPEAMAVAPDGTVYAAHVGDGNTPYEAIEVFAPGANGYFECSGNETSGGSPVTAQRYVGGTNSGLDKVTQLALDSSGNVYAANNYGNSVTVYGPTANGDVAPNRKITGPDTGISGPTGVSVDQFGNLYVLNSHSADAGMSTITVYAPGANGDAAPVRTLTLPTTNWNGNLALIK